MKSNVRMSWLIHLYHPFDEDISVEMTRYNNNNNNNHARTQETKKILSNGAFQQ